MLIPLGAWEQRVTLPAESVLASGGSRARVAPIPLNGTSNTRGAIDEAIMRSPMATTAAICHDWALDEIEAVYALPLPELVFRAQTVHRTHHDPLLIQGCALLSVKQAAARKIVPTALSRHATKPASVAAL
jgi:hypothetical protein